MGTTGRVHVGSFHALFPRAVRSIQGAVRCMVKPMRIGLSSPLAAVSLGPSYGLIGKQFVGCHSTSFFCFFFLERVDATRPPKLCIPSCYTAIVAGGEKRVTTSAEMLISPFCRDRTSPRIRPSDRYSPELNNTATTTRRKNPSPPIAFSSVTRQLFNLLRSTSLLTIQWRPFTRCMDQLFTAGGLQLFMRSLHTRTSAITFAKQATSWLMFSCEARCLAPR